MCWLSLYSYIVYVFFNSSRSLLIDSCIFSILFSKFLIIFTLIILNSFSGNFLFTYLYFCVPSLFLHLCSISLPFHYFLNLLCLRSAFLRHQGWILSSFWFLPSSGWSIGLCEVCIGWDLCWVFVCLFVWFSSDGQGWVKW